MSATSMSVEIEWAAVQALDRSPALSVWMRYDGGALSAGGRGDIHHVIPQADLEQFNPPLCIWQLIAVACEPALEAQRRRAAEFARVEAAAAKRARKQASRITRITLDDAIQYMADADVPRGVLVRRVQDHNLALLAGVDTPGDED